MDLEKNLRSVEAPPVQEQLRPFLNKASDDLREDVPLLEFARQKRFADMVQEIAPALLSQLSSKAG